MAETQEKIQLPNENIKKKLDEVIRGQELINYKIKLSAGSKKGDNYASITYKIAVSGYKANGESVKFNLFCKTPVEIEGFRQEDSSNDSFQRENKIYEEVIKEMKLLESNKGIQDGFTSYAKSYATGSDNFEEFIILEDLTCKGFVLYDQMKQLDLNHTQLVMKALAKFHAYSFLLRKENPEVLKKYSEELTEVLVKEDMQPFFQNLTDNFLQSVVKKLKFEGIYQEKWEQFYLNYHRIIKDCVKGSLAEPYAAVTHGDCWNNNIMFKYENGVPTEVCLLDWQVARYCSPVIDLVYYIFCCTEKPFRDQHYKTILDIYYDTFSTFLKQLGGDPEQMFPYSEFENQLKKFGKFGLGMAIILIPAIVVKQEDVISAEEMSKNASHLTENEKTFNIWTSRFSDVVKDMVDLGYL